MYHLETASHRYPAADSCTRSGSSLDIHHSIGSAQDRHKSRTHRCYKMQVLHRPLQQIVRFALDHVRLPLRLYAESRAEAFHGLVHVALAEPELLQ